MEDIRGIPTFDIGAPRMPESNVDPEGNIDHDFDDFSPENPATPSQGNIHAFQLVSAGDALYVRKGTVNGVIPTLGGTPLDDDYTENELSIPGTASRTYWLKAVSTGGLDDEGVTSVTIEIADPGADTAAQAKQTLGSVTTDSGDVESFSSNLTGSQNLESCGSIHSWNVI